MMRRFLTGLALIAFALPLGAQQNSQTTEKKSQTIEKVGTGDTLRVAVFGQPDMLTEGRVSDRGMISLPLVGEVRVAGATTSEAGNRIAEALKSGQFLKNPQ